MCPPHYANHINAHARLFYALTGKILFMYALCRFVCHIQNATALLHSFMDVTLMHYCSHTGGLIKQLSELYRGCKWK